MALFTVITPVHVILIHDFLRGRFRLVPFLTALGGAFGALVLKYSGDFKFSSLTGFLLVQISNFAFAAGQVWYRRVRPEFGNRTDSELFALPYLGAAAVSFIPFLVEPRALLAISALSLNQVLVLLYLGAIASGLCFFGWNKGATLTAPGPLAVLNNLKVPSAVAVSILVFGETGDWPKLLLSGTILAVSAWIASIYEKRYE